MPFLFLVLTIPVPEALLQFAIDVLKDGSTEMVAWLFTVTGLTVRQGRVHVRPSFNLDTCRRRV